MAIETHPTPNQPGGEVAINWHPLEERIDANFSLEIHTESHGLEINPYGNSTANVYTQVTFLGDEVAVAEVELNGTATEIQTQFDSRSALAPDTKAKVTFKDYLKTLENEGGAEQEVYRKNMLRGNILVDSVVTLGTVAVAGVAGFDIGRGHVSGPEIFVAGVGATLAALFWSVKPGGFRRMIRSVHQDGISRGKKIGKVELILNTLESKTVESTEQKTESA